MQIDFHGDGQARPERRAHALILGLRLPRIAGALVAGAVMGIMLIPFVSSLSDDIINAVPQSLRDGSLAMGATPSETIRKVILPAALPTIFTGIRLAGAASILVLITTELVGAKAGLGYLISRSQFNFQIPQMYAGIVTVAAVGVGFNQLLVFLERRVSGWRVENH